MDNITIYQKPTCTTCKKVFAALKESGTDFNSVNYFTEPLAPKKIKELLLKMGIPAAELLRTKEAKYKELKFAEKNYSDGEIVDLMAIHPELIERPIVEQGDRAILARPAERITEFLSTAKPD